MRASVVIPTYNEAGNVLRLVTELTDSFRGRPVELLFVDDSTDGTPAVIRQCAALQPHWAPVRLLHRPADERTGGLSGAVVAGLRAARGDLVVVMDADLQHPPALASVLVDEAAASGADLVVASRYVDQGSSAGLAGRSRRGVSQGSTLLARLLFPRRVGRVCSDPLTGFFCVRPGSLHLGALQPRGFKILLEILARHDLRVAEVPLRFAARHSGDSKASARTGLAFLAQLTALRLPIAVLRGLLGAVVGALALAGLLAWTSLSPLAVALSTAAVVLAAGFVLEHAWVPHAQVAAESYERRTWSPPTDEEKDAYLVRPQHRWLFWVQALAFTGVAWSLYGMTQNAAWTLFFAVPLVLYTVEQLLALRTATFRRRVTAASHRELVTGWSPRSWPHVDVFLPTAGEPLELLDTTYRHVSELHWKGGLSVHVLDDAGRPEVEALCLAHGFTYLAREDSAFKKAGNLQHGLRHSSGELVAILDADFLPRPDFLRELAPYFDDPSVGIVQSPQYFPTDPEAGWLERCAGATQELFYRMVQPSRDAVGAAICVGTSALYRRAALDAIGGFPQIGHSEDVYTGVEMNRVGFGVRYVPVLVTQGRSPQDLDAFIAQQYRWAEGSLSLLTDRRFHEERSMTTAQRLSFWSGFLYYVTTALNAVLAPLAVLVMVWFFPGRVSSVDVLPLLGAAACWLCLLPLVSYGRWRVEVLRVQVVYGFAHLFCLWDLLRGSTSEWVATGASQHRQPLPRRVRRAMSTYVLLTQVAVVAGLVRGITEYGLERYWGNAVLAAVSCYVVVPVALLALRRRRAPASEPVVLDLRQPALLAAAPSWRAPVLVPLAP